MAKIKVFKVGRFKTNCYLVSNDEENRFFLVDPGGKIKNFDVSSYKIDYILLTHGHFDHISNVAEYKELTGAKVVISKAEEDLINDGSLNLSSRFMKAHKLKSFEADILCSEGDEIPFAGGAIKVLDTPGHTKGGVCYIFENNIFSGDTLFKGTYGATSFPTGSEAELENSLLKLANLEGDFNVYPGHSEVTKLSDEREAIIKNNF